MTAEYEFYTIQHHLKDILKLTDVAVSQITEESVEEYEAEYQEMREAYRKDAQTISQTKSDARKNISDIFGELSKQIKYFDRNLRLERSKVDTHYEMYPTPMTSKERIRTANEKVSDSGSRSVTKPNIRAGVNEQEMEEVDASIRYLITKGYTYGVDFNSHNAVEIAQCASVEVIEKLVDEDDEGVVEYVSEKPECCGKFDIESSQSRQDGNITLWCECNEDRGEYSVNLNDSKITLERIANE